MVKYVVFRYLRNKTFAFQAWPTLYIFSVEIFNHLQSKKQGYYIYGWSGLSLCCATPTSNEFSSSSLPDYFFLQQKHNTIIQTSTIPNLVITADLDLWMWPKIESLI